MSHDLVPVRIGFRIRRPPVAITILPPAPEPTAIEAYLDDLAATAWFEQLERAPRIRRPMAWERRRASVQRVHRRGRRWQRK